MRLTVRSSSTGCSGVAFQYPRKRVISAPDVSPRLWAQRQIAGLIDAIRQSGADGTQPSKELVNEIIALSTEFGILTEYTAFLAAEDADFGGLAFDSRGRVDREESRFSSAPAAESARDSLADYLRFLDMANGSVCELEYQISLAHRLGYLPDVDELNALVVETAKVLNGLIRSLRKQ